MWHVSFSVLFHLAWCPQVPSMLLAAAEFPSISWWNVPSLSPYQVVSFMAGIEVYTASVSFLGINNILLSKPGVSTPPPTSAPQCLIGISNFPVILQPELYHSDWLTVCEKFFLLLQAIAFFLIHTHNISQILSVSSCHLPSWRSVPKSGSQWDCRLWTP